jgi:ribosome modulation factor
MRSPKLFRLLAFVLTAFGPLWAAERITLEFRPSEGASCGELNIPRPWSVPLNVTDSLDADALRDGFKRGRSNYEFRRSERLLVGIYVGVKRKGLVLTGSSYSPDNYAIVQQNGMFVLTSTGKGEWESARVLPRSLRHPSVAKMPKDRQSLQYAGRPFAPSGHHWWDIYHSSFISSDEAYLSLFTYDGKVGSFSDPLRIDPFVLFESHRQDGHYFIDLFHVSTGRKLALITGRFHDVFPYNLATQSSWIEGPRFAMPISRDMRRLAFCEVQ